MKRLFQIVPAGSSIIAMIPYRVVNMDMKKVMALAMMALMVIPSLTMTVGAVAEEDMACAIERARIYLGKVRTLADNMADEYEGDETMEGYLIQLYPLLGQYEYEGPEYLLQSENGIAERSDVESYSGTHSVHLKTIGKPGDGDEARIVIPMPEGYTLDDLETISWTIYALAGYPAHVDIFLDNAYVLTAEQASNNPAMSSSATAPTVEWCESARQELGAPVSTSLLCSVARKSLACAKKSGSASPPIHWGVVDLFLSIYHARLLGSVAGPGERGG